MNQPMSDTDFSAAAKAAIENVRRQVQNDLADLNAAGSCDELAAMLVELDEKLNKLSQTAAGLADDSVGEDAQ